MIGSSRSGAAASAACYTARMPTILIRIPARLATGAIWDQPLVHAGLVIVATRERSARGR